MNPELVNKNHVLQAITEFDRLGRDAFLKKYDFGKSKQYLLLHKEKTYDSKPIYGVAHGFATDDFLTAKDFSGGLDHAAGYLVDLGFNVPEPVKAAAWIFQANPNRYDIVSAVQANRKDVWATNQHRTSIVAGDKVYFYHSGKNAGIYAVGRVVSLPFDRGDSSEFGQWAVNVEYEQLLQPYISREDIRDDVILNVEKRGEVKLFQRYQGTNWPLSDAASKRLDILVSSRNSLPVSESMALQVYKSLIKDSYSPNYWWVNQNQTFKEEFSGGYLWSPKIKSNGAKNQFYDNMTLVRSGDVVMSFADRYIKAIGIATETASTRPKPKQFGDNWNHADEEGWYVPVDYTELQNPILPREHMDVLGPLQPSKYYPLQRNGNGLQGVYLASLPAEMWKALVELLSGQVEPIRQSTGVDAFTENLNDRHEQELNNRDDIGETERTHLAKSRRGQGLFKKRVSERESQCRVTGVTDLHHLRASHIKPWKDSTDYEKLDGDNGLLLAPHVDHLFDRGFISFTRQGKVLVSAKLDSSVLTSWQVNSSKNVGEFSSEQDQYLAYHRSEILKK